MELYIFFKSKNKPKDKLFELEYFKYDVTTDISPSFKNGIDKFQESYTEEGSKEFNPLSIERGSKKLEYLELEQLKIDAKVFEIYHKIINLNQLKDFKEEVDEKVFLIRKLGKFSAAENPPFFYAVKTDEKKVFFKKTSDSNLFMKNDYKIYLRRDNAKELPLEDIMVIDTRFDFYISAEKVFIRNGSSFEIILDYETVYKKHKEKIIDRIGQEEVIDDFESFKKACNKADYFRAFRVVPDKLDFKNAFTNEGFIEKLEKDTNGKVKWNKEKGKISLADMHIKTVLHIFSGLIGIDIYNEIVTFNDKQKLPK